jgi:hypothetical protein
VSESTTSAPSDQEAAILPPLEQVQALRAEREQITNRLDDIDSSLARLLDSGVERWEDVEPVPCGHTGGWMLSRDPFSADGKVRLVHDCFSMHQYDLHVNHSTQAPLDRLLELGTSPA